MGGAVFTPTRTVVTVRRFQDMVAAGVWRDDERIELIDGEIVDMAPIGGAQAWCVTRVAELLRARVGDRAHVWVQLPIVLGERSQPQPDLALIRNKAEGYDAALPSAEDVLLAIEVPTLRSGTTAAPSYAFTPPTASQSTGSSTCRAGGSRRIAALGRPVTRAGK